MTPEQIPEDCTYGALASAAQLLFQRSLCVPLSRDRCFFVESRMVHTSGRNWGGKKIEYKA